MENIAAIGLSALKVLFRCFPFETPMYFGPTDFVYVMMFVLLHSCEMSLSGKTSAGLVSLDLRR